MICALFLIAEGFFELSAMEALALHALKSPAWYVGAL